jgi:hypothetical protein
MIGDSESPDIFATETQLSAFSPDLRKALNSKFLTIENYNVVISSSMIKTNLPTVFSEFIESFFTSLIISQGMVSNCRTVCCSKT